jgi:hypothetical protein
MHWVFQSSNLHGNVVLNFRHNAIDDLAAFARGYHQSGKRLAAMLASSSGYSDFDGYPILFLYRHALELYMKTIVYRGAQLLHLLDIERTSTSKLFNSHRLSLLLPGVKAVFERIEETWETETAGIRNFNEFEELVRGIEELDPESYSFRYPTNTKGQAALNHHTLVNAVGFSGNMDPILDLLDGAVTGLYEAFDSAAEAHIESDSSAFRDWFQSYLADEWDRQIEADAAAGKLDHLAREALAEHKAGRTKPL